MYVQCMSKGAGYCETHFWAVTKNVMTPAIQQHDKVLGEGKASHKFSCIKALNLWTWPLQAHRYTQIQTIYISRNHVHVR